MERMRSGRISDRRTVPDAGNCGRSAGDRVPARITARDVIKKKEDAMVEERKIANEAKAAFYAREEMQWLDRCQFVGNLGWLLRQTREGKDNETAIIWYNDGSREEVNVSCDSYIAIIKDVMKHI